MGVEQKINQQLNKYPAIKRTVKSVYQHTMYAISSKVDHEGNVIRLSPDDPKHEYFFGYYDKSPWDASGRYALCLKAKDTWSDVAPKDPAEILLIDTEQDNKATKIAMTHSWNVQQGCMAQWLGPKFNQEIIYNDFRDGKFVSVVLNVFTGKERVLAKPVYSVASDGSFALTLDFARLHRLRPGYGYSNVEETTKNEKIPDAPCIWKLDIINNTVEPVLKNADFASFEPRREMAGAEHKVNHIMVSPNGKRFMVLHRWFNGDRKYSRLVTVNVDGTEMYNLSDDDMVSHCYWRNDEEIIAFENKKGTGAGYYLMRDKTQVYTHLWPHITSDGHPSYSPDGKLVVADTYPNRSRMALIKVMNNDVNTVVARVFAPFKYDNDTRCDLHPRWSRDGKSICFDSVFEGHRGLYMVKLDGIRFADSETTGSKLKPNSGNPIKIVYLMTSCKKTGPTQQTLNIIKNLDHDKFQPTLITLYDEELDSRMADYLPYVSAHYLVKTGKKSIVLDKDTALRKKLEEIQPDIIHSVGVFPDYAVSRIGKYRQVMTLRNFIYDDYPAKFGAVKGNILAKLQLYAMKRASKVVACSESLTHIYDERLHLHFDAVQNGVDVEQYTKATEVEKRQIREELKLPNDKFVFVYTGQFIERKNIPFLLENYAREFDGGKTVMLMLGDGPELDALKRIYAGRADIDFHGSVSNINQYLKACDAYVSTSKSEGLPNGVLEAMAVGLPVVLSDILQHKEIFDADAEIGFLYKQGDAGDYAAKLRGVFEGNVAEMGHHAYKAAHESFSAKGMSEKYQGIYSMLTGEKNRKNG